MAHTPEQRDRRALCEAKKKNGERCRAFAGQGTDHPGSGRCKFHGGSTPSHRQHAVVDEAVRRMVKLGSPVRVHPLEALLSMLHFAAGHAQWLNAEIAALDDLSTPEGHALVALYGEERDRVAKVAKACLDAGVAERQVRLAEEYGAQLADLLQSIFSDPALRLDPDQRSALRTILPRYLRTLEVAPARAA